ncbi:MAG: hypothetical protein J7501_15130, partial [Bdellovibrio sp.]|nr:hypothetical protein [Bdellovibrio sp.]
ELGLFRVQVNLSKTGGYSDATYVMANLNSGEVYSSWDAQGRRITFANSAAYKDVAKNAQMIESQIEMEKGDLSKALGQLKDGKATQYTAGKTTLPAIQTAPGKIALWTLNALLKATAMNMHIYELNTVVASNPKLDILKTFPTLYSNMDMQMGSEKEALRIALKYQVLEVGKIQ